METGKSLAVNGLKEIATVFESEGVLVTSGDLYLPKGSDRFMDAVRDRIFATIYSRNNPEASRKKRGLSKYILRRR